MNEQLVPKCTNNAYQVTVRCDDKQIQFNLVDRVMNFELADGPYFYMARRPGDEGSIISEWLANAVVTLNGDTIAIHGQLAGLELEHRLCLPSDRSILEEQITLRNPTKAGTLTISLRLAPWSTQVVEVHPLKVTGT